MIQLSSLPHIDNVRWLAKVAGPYPLALQTIIQAAQEWNFSDSSIKFLELFPPEQEFTSQADFIARCEELETLAPEAQHVPVELSL